MREDDGVTKVLSFRRKAQRPLHAYLSCSPAIITSALCCRLMVFLLMLLVRSMSAVCAPRSVWS